MRSLRPQTVALLAFCNVVITACGTTPLPPKLPTSAPPPANAITDVKEAFEATTSDYEDLLALLAKEPGNYYFQLRVRSAQMPNDPYVCFAEPIEQFLRQLFFKKASMAGVILIKTSSSDPAISGITHESPVVTVVHDENVQPPNPKCYTSAFNGYVTPLIRADALTTITVTPSRKYSAQANVTATSSLFEAASTASLAFTGAPLALQVFNVADLQSKAANVDAKLSAAFSGVVADDRTFTFPASDSKNAIVVRMLNVAHDSLRGAHLSDQVGGLAIIDLVPIKSVFATRPKPTNDASYKPTYYKDWHPVLATTIREGGRSISDLVVGDWNFKGDAAKIDANASDAGKKLGELCKTLSTHLSNDLRLSNDDVRIARWASLKEYTPYDSDSNLRSDDCWSKEDAKAMPDGTVFVFNDQRQDPSKTVKPALDALSEKLLNALLVLGDGRTDGLKNLVNPTKFRVIDWGNAPTLPENAKWSDLSSEATLTALGKLGPFGAGCWQAPLPPAGLAKSAVLLRQFSKPASLYNVAVVRDADMKIVSLIFGDADAITSYVDTPVAWPKSCG